MYKIVNLLTILVFWTLLVAVQANHDAEAPRDGGLPIECIVYNTQDGQLVGEDLEIHCNGTIFKEEETKDEPGSPIFIFHGSFVIILVLVAGLMSGLTIGLVGLDLTTVEILARSGTAKEKEHAAKILPMIKKHHLLLVTLLLTNAAAMEALPIFLERMVPNWAAVLISVTLVLFFGEIIPQAICARWGLAVGASVHWIVWGLMTILFPISWPISKILDAILGHKTQTLFRRNQLKEFVNFHSDDRLQNDTIGQSNHDGADHDDESALPDKERLSYDEVLIIKGALDMKGKSIGDVMTPVSKLFMLDLSSILDLDKLKEIRDAGRSRIPVYDGEKSKIIGFILLKSLFLVDFSVPVPLSSLEIRKIPQVSMFTPLYKMLNIFQTGRSHIACVMNDRNESIGIATLEDILEELIGEEIHDEVDFDRRNKDLELKFGADSLSLARNLSLIAKTPAKGKSEASISLDSDDSEEDSDDDKLQLLA